MITQILTLDPMLQRNLGYIREVKNLKMLGSAIETGQIIAVSDASIGTRSRSARSYVITTKCSKASIRGTAPVDCEIDDLESTRAEIFGSIAIHTLLQVISDMFEVITGEVEVYCDNKDALCKQPIKTKDISFPRFFRPNVDIKLQIRLRRRQLRKI